MKNESDITSISEAYRSMHEASSVRQRKKFKKQLEKLDSMVNDAMLTVEEMEGLFDSWGDQLDDEVYREYIRTSAQMMRSIEKLQNYIQ